MDDKLKKDIAAIVAEIFSEKEEVDARKMTEEALQTSAATIEELTASLETKNEEVAELESKISDHDGEIETLKSELEAAKTEGETTKEELVAANTQIEDMVKDKAADGRMSDLEEAGVARSDKDAQREKVREMSEEDFTAYKDELTSIREAVLVELKASKEEETASEEETEEETASEEETEEETASEEETEEEVTTPPANVDPAQAVSAAMNMEIFPSDEIMAKYDALGKAMASAFTDKE